MKDWLRSVLQSRAQALAEVRLGFRQAPLGTALGALVIAIALALPMGLYGLIRNAERLVGGWDRGNEISVYLHRSVPGDEGQALAATLARRPDIAGARYVSPADGLQELAAAAHLGDTLALLPQNPLPGVIVLKPAPTLTATGITRLLTALRALAPVAHAEADLEWVQRLAAGLRVARRLGLLVALALALGVVVTVGNTARLQILNRRGDIEIMKLVGATPGFIRRPFVYAGAAQGLLGGIIGFVLLVLARWSLAGPMARLTALYGSHFALEGPGVSGFAVLTLGGLALGWLGARVAVAQHLGEIEPR